MVNAGTPLQFTVAGSVGAYVSSAANVANNMRAAAIADLNQYGTVNALAIDIGSVSTRLLAGELFRFPYTATVTFTPRSAYGDARDVGSLVAHAFYVSTGSMPTATVAAAPAPGGLGGVSIGPGSSISDQVSSLLNSIIRPVTDPVKDAAKGIEVTTVLLGVGIVAIVYLIATGPNVKSIARAAR